MMKATNERSLMRMINEMKPRDLDLLVVEPKSADVLSKPGGYVKRTLIFLSHVGNISR